LKEKKLLAITKDVSIRDFSEFTAENDVASSKSGSHLEKQNSTQKYVSELTDAEFISWISSLSPTYIELFATIEIRNGSQLAELIRKKGRPELLKLGIKVGHVITIMKRLTFEDDKRKLEDAS